MTWKIDSAHTQITFSVRHMMIATVRGEFQQFSGEVTYDEANPANTHLTVAIDTASINTRFGDRDNHLRSADFFNSAEYPAMTFASRKVEVLNNTSAKLHGDLTIRDITRPVVLDVTLAGKATSPWGQTSAGFSATGKLNRTDWGLNWNQGLEAGGVLVGEEVTLNIEAELVQQLEAEAEAAAA